MFPLPDANPETAGSTRHKSKPFPSSAQTDVTKPNVGSNMLWQKISREEDKLLMLIKFRETFCLWYVQYKQLICGVHT